MAIYKTAIKNPVTTMLVFVAVMIIGLFCFVQLPVDQFPEMDPPYVMVMTTYPGASASEIETNVSKIMENSLTSVDNLKYINSTSKDNVSLVVLSNWNGGPTLRKPSTIYDRSATWLRTSCLMVVRRQWCSSSHRAPCQSANMLSRQTSRILHSTKSSTMR